MLVILSGCSGGGKTTLIEELARRGYTIMPEPGLRIVREERENGGSALPWIDPAAFARRAVEMARNDLPSASSSGGPVFFDRGLIDAVAALEFATGEDHAAAYPKPGVFCRTAFLVPPWPEHFHQSVERQHGMSEAVGEYERLLKVYARLGFATEILPREPVERRADRILAMIGLA
ncbi:AAA family ATPase [Erythrobacter mangrovi]|uniref:AAA family ATPase n=1 Tax=Erythrobacter mangrovi TaxID=2739433 RepID=A0A7D4BM95_9SPHN|nr:AAA family ATPase [Erythrobacter mangrovi]QKG70084.1 AAA family ATPase [Erythrobacter mangrovi]